MEKSLTGAVRCRIAATQMWGRLAGHGVSLLCGGRGDITSGFKTEVDEG
jgi:hypothetical protein